MILGNKLLFTAVGLSVLHLLWGSWMRFPRDVATAEYSAPVAVAFDSVRVDKNGIGRAYLATGDINYLTAKGPCRVIVDADFDGIVLIGDTAAIQLFKAEKEADNRLIIRHQLISKIHGITPRDSIIAAAFSVWPTLTMRIGVRQIMASRGPLRFNFKAQHIETRGVLKAEYLSLNLDCDTAHVSVDTKMLLLCSDGPTWRAAAEREGKIVLRGRATVLDMHGAESVYINGAELHTRDVYLQRSRNSRLLLAPTSLMSATEIRSTNIKLLTEPPFVRIDSTETSF